MLLYWYDTAMAIKWDNDITGAATGMKGQWSGKRTAMPWNGNGKNQFILSWH